MREYGQEYADSTLRHPSMGRCKHGNYVCQQCVKEHEAKGGGKLPTPFENKTPSLSSLNN